MHEKWRKEVGRMDEGSFRVELLRKVIIKSNNKPNGARIHICVGLHEKSVCMLWRSEGQEGSWVHVEASNGGMLRTLATQSSNADVLCHTQTGNFNLLYQPFSNPTNAAHHITVISYSMHELFCTNDIRHWYASGSGSKKPEISFLIRDKELCQC